MMYDREPETGGSLLHDDGERPKPQSGRWKASKRATLGGKRSHVDKPIAGVIWYGGVGNMHATS